MKKQATHWKVWTPRPRYFQHPDFALERADRYFRRTGVLVAVTAPLYNGTKLDYNHTVQTTPA